MPRRVLALVGLVSILFWFAPAPGAEASVPAGTYVALGDSYTAGPLIPLYDEPYGCLRSATLNYPHILARELRLNLRDASCSGADTNDMANPQGVTPGPNPPQLDRLDPDVSLVSLQIGGNDIGFSSISRDCVTLVPTGHPCQDRYVVGGVDELSRRIAATLPKVQSVLKAIHARAPRARVLVIPYIAIFPEGSPVLCWPQLPIAYEDVAYLRAKQKELNAMLATAAVAENAEYIDVYRSSIGHDSCQPPGLRWVEPAVPANLAAPLHPNVLGMIGVSDKIVAELRGR